MATLGFHLVASLVAALFLGKFLSLFPLTRWLLSELLLYIVPDNSYLSEFVQLALSSGNGGKSRAPRKNANEKKHTSGTGGAAATAADKDVNLPKDIPLPLFTGVIKAKDVEVLLYFSDLHWVLHITAASALVFAASEIFQALAPAAWRGDINLTILWLALVLYCTVKMLGLLTWLVVGRSSDSSSERTLVGLSVLCFFILAVLVLIVEGSWLDLGVDAGFTQLLSGPVSGKGRRKSASLILMLKTFLCLSAAVLSSILVFPSLRLARSYLSALRQSGIAERILFQISFVSPLLLLCLWVPPLTTDLLFPLKKDPTLPWLSRSQFEHGRLLLVLLFCLLRIAVARRHLQQYLHSVHNRVEAHRRRVARFTGKQFRNTVRTVNGSLAIVALQYLCPIIILLTFVLLLHSLGSYSWSGQFLEPVAAATPKAEDLRFSSRVPAFISAVFPSALLASVLSFYVVWMLASLALTTCLGFVYATYTER